MAQESEAKIDLTRFRSCAMAKLTAADVEQAVARIVSEEPIDWMRDRLGQAIQAQKLGSENCNCGSHPHGPRCFYTQAGAARREELYREAIARVEAAQVSL
jgi:hypothetical protein